MRIALPSIFLLAALLPFPSLAAATALVTATGGVNVTGDDVVAEAAQRIAPEVRAQLLSQPADAAQLAIGIAARRLLAVEAEQSQLDKDPRIAAQLRLARERILAEARLERIEGDKPDRAALERLALAEYRAQPEKFRTPEEVRVRHILIDARSCEAEKRIGELLLQARAPGADFAALAREHSQDPGSAKRGGDLGFFPAGRMAPEFDKAAFALKNPGEVSDAVKTKFGWHIIRLEERRPAGQQPFEKVRDSIVEDLATRESRNRRTLATEALMKGIQVDKAAVEAFAKQPH
jgi:peptidyl-prolyl cis-trans isomerase C